MNTILHYLKQLDFSTSEAKLYITLLKAGPLTVAELAEAAKINRTAAYSHINSLVEKGIIAKVKGSTNKVAATSPDQLHILVEQKATQVSKLQEKLPSVVTFLNSAIPQTNTSSQSEIKYYKGIPGVKTVYQDVLKSTTIRAYFNPGELAKVFPENEKLFNDTIIRNPKVKMYEIAADTLQIKSYMEYFGSADKLNRHYWKLLPKDVKLMANDILIYDGKVAIINVKDKNNVDGVILKNRDYYTSSVQLFDLLWRFLPEPEK